jgi:hypothetical protein
MAAGLFLFFDESNCVNHVARWANRMDNLVMDNLSPDYFKLANFKGIYLMGN